MKRAFLFVLLITLVSFTFSQNLVINPGFETWSKINRPSGWTHAESCQKDSLNILSGSYSCSHTCTGSASNCLGQLIPVIAGKEYQLNLSYKTSDNTTGNGARIWCYWKDSSGNNITDPPTDDILRPSKYMKSDTWQNISLEITAPVNAASLYLEVRTYPGSATWWDNFFFGENATTEITDIGGSMLKIYPVPVRDILNIESREYIHRIEILNTLGISMLSVNTNGESSDRLSIGSLPGGIYILRIYAGDHVYFRKISKQND